MSILSSRLFLVSLLFGGVFLYGGTRVSTSDTYDVYSRASTTAHMATGTLALAPVASSTPARFVPTHLSTPEPVKAVYMTSCIASGKNLRAPMVKLVDQTELNAIIIDIKDFSGMVSIEMGDPRFVLNTKGCHIPDIKEFIAQLHEKGIYVIGRVTVMQDSVYTKSHPDAAVKKKSDGTTWKDKKGLAFVDPGAKEYWQYMVDLGKASYDLGFDEINYDYIRYPSDGDMSDAWFARSASSTKPAMMEKFYIFLSHGMHEFNIPISADLFGMTTTNTDDLGIGQVLESALRTFDYVAPMVYPSHYPPNFNGWRDPNLVPGPVVQFAMTRAVERANALERKESGFDAAVIASSTASSTAVKPKFVSTGLYAKKLRPWIQDFDYGKDYTAADVRAQKDAVVASGLTSWMMWDPRNVYTTSAYDPE